MATSDDRTIRDFGDQWVRYAGNEGYYGSVELLQDMFGPLLPLAAVRGARVADVGSGTGRIVRMLLAAGAAHVVALEPSAGIEALRANTRDAGDRVEVIHGTGEALPAGRDLDLVTVIGVLPFLEDPEPLLRAARRALRPGGRILVWVYGVEGNAAYLRLLRLLRSVTTRLPHAALSGLCSVLTLCVDAYTGLCRLLPLPLHDYLVNTLARVPWDKRKLTIYDQLNPSYVKFHTRDEVREMLERAGFADVALHHRRGYSWTAIGVAPDGSPAFPARAM